MLLHCVGLPLPKVQSRASVVVYYVCAVLTSVFVFMSFVNYNSSQCKNYRNLEKKNNLLMEEMKIEVFYLY